MMINGDHVPLAHGILHQMRLLVLAWDTGNGRVNSHLLLHTATLPGKLVKIARPCSPWCIDGDLRIWTDEDLLEAIFKEVPHGKHIQRTLLVK